MTRSAWALFVTAFVAVVGMWGVLWLWAWGIAMSDPLAWLWTIAWLAVSLAVGAAILYACTLPPRRRR
jgi:hypothetical protein